MRNFNFSAWSNFQDQPIANPGQLFDMTDHEGVSAVPEGGVVPYGRMLVRGSASQSATNAALSLTDRHYTFMDSVCLPDVNGVHLIDPTTGDNYTTAGISLPTDANGDLIVAGVGIWTEYNSCWNERLSQPWGLNDRFYQPVKQGQIGMATQGNIWAYCETDMEVGDEVFFRTVITGANLTDGVSLLGAFANANSAEHQQLVSGTVMRPGPAGGAFVLNLNSRK